ncbi:hypothetical protein GR131_27790 [Streptomyces sp. GF20]|uniref:hypothetical protein n=1 Tax=Streptomyces sp. GF20 TaxID=2692235 RepID=UPI001319990D|nr:hypothetical protein [Streptomyces sp. GF20]QHC18928.1 hypothetical protein GR131_27790 [Streptomyces sp. GF20]
MTEPSTQVTSRSPPHGDPLSTSACIARSTPSGGYEGIYLHFDGTPGDKLPLLLAARRWRFRGDLEAMQTHLIDSPTTGWEEIGTDLLDGVPPVLAAKITGGQQWPSVQLGDAIPVVTTDGSPLQRDLITDATAGGWGIEWVYVLNADAIAVVHVPTGSRQNVPWSADLLSPLGDQRPGHRQQAPSAAPPRPSHPRRSAAR